MDYKITVPGTFASLNEFIAANRVRRGNWSKANDMKKKDQAAIIPCILRTIKTELQPPIYLDYTFYAPNHKRDKDNIASYFTKIFQDSLVESGVLTDDSWKYIEGYRYSFEVDKENPRIEIIITEREEV